jgi:hypothetical protein
VNHSAGPGRTGVSALARLRGKAPAEILAAQQQLAIRYAADCKFELWSTVIGLIRAGRAPVHPGGRRLSQRGLPARHAT